MGVISDRVSVLFACANELVRHGLPRFVQCGDQDIVVLLDGVGGFQFLPLVVRKVFRDNQVPISSTWIRWQTPIPGLMLADLMWRSRNQRSAMHLADQLQSLHRRLPNSRIHIVSYSGGTGVAAFSLELLGGRVPIETLLMLAPALSPGYNLASMMSNVRRAYVTMSCKDTWLLGAGTRLFGTMDRKRVRSAGMVGFTVPHGLSRAEQEAYSRIREIVWCDDFRDFKHSGGHIGWIQIPFLQKHLPPLLAGEPLLPSRHLTPIGAGETNRRTQ